MTDTKSVEEVTLWWEELTGRGGEGMVVKPLDFIVRGRRGLTQPAVKCRGPEYLRIIYGPEYLLPENLERLRSRSVSAKRSLALREFALGIEALERFVRQEPLRRVQNASSVCWPLKASQSILVSKRGRLQSSTAPRRSPARLLAMYILYNYLC